VQRSGEREVKAAAYISNGLESHPFNKRRPLTVDDCFQDEKPERLMERWLERQLQRKESQERRDKEWQQQEELTAAGTATAGALTLAVVVTTKAAVAVVAAGTGMAGALAGAVATAAAATVAAGKVILGGFVWSLWTYCWPQWTIYCGRKQMPRKRSKKHTFFPSDSLLQFLMFC